MNFNNFLLWLRITSLVVLSIAGYKMGQVVGEFRHAGDPGNEISIISEG